MTINSDVPLASQLDVSGLVSDLIRADAKSWLANHFEGDVDLSTPEVDSLGRLHQVQAKYDNKGPSGYRGSVTITFSGGQPSCLYFADNSKSCRRPDPSVVKAYQGGKYKTASKTKTVIASSTPPPLTTSSEWRVTHAHISQDSDGRTVTATANWPALNKAGKTAGTLRVTANCNDVLLSISVEVVNARGYELAQSLRTSDAQLGSRVPLLVSINGSLLPPLNSISQRENTVEIEFEGPGFSKGSGAAQGAVALGQLINGSRFLGVEDKLFGASSLKIGIPVSHGGIADAFQFSLSPQDPIFSRFASACRKLDPAHAPDPETELVDLTNDAAALLPPTVAAELHDTVTHFDDGLKRGDEIAINDGYTRLYSKVEAHAGDACHTGNAHACEAVDTLADLRDQFIVMMNDAKQKSRQIAQAARLSAPQGTAFKFFLTNKITLDQIAPRGTTLDAQMSGPLTSNGRVLVEQGSGLHVYAFVSGNAINLSVKEIVKNGHALRVWATPCQLPIKSDSSPYRRPGQPGYRPFSVVPGQGADPSQRYVAAGTECSVLLNRPLSLP